MTNQTLWEISIMRLIRLQTNCRILKEQTQSPNTIVPQVEINLLITNYDGGTKGVELLKHTIPHNALPITQSFREQCDKEL